MHKSSYFPRDCLRLYAKVSPVSYLIKITLLISRKVVRGQSSHPNCRLIFVSQINLKISSEVPNSFPRAKYLLRCSVIFFICFFKYVILKVFYLSILTISHKFGIHFHPLQKDGEHSWMDYIYSPSMLYGDNSPFVIELFTSVLSNNEF